MYESYVYGVISRAQKKLVLRSWDHAVRNFKKKRRYAQVQEFFWMEFFYAFGLMPKGMHAIARGE